MATRRELIYNALDILNKGAISDDFLPSYRQMGFIIDYVRARLIRQDREKNWSRQTEFQQDLGNLNLIKVDAAECSGLVLGCDVYKTELELPKFVRFKDKPGITFAGAVDKVSRIDLILPERVPFIKHSKFTSGVPRLYYMNNHLYSTSNELIAINVKGILEKPEDAKRFRCGDGPCFTEDSEYPLPLDMVSMLMEFILKVDLANIAFQLDKENDGTQSQQ